MIRPFDIRDVSVVQRLSPLGRALAYELFAVDGLSPLREALRTYAAGGSDHRAALVRRSADHNTEAFGLLQFLDDPSNEDRPDSTRQDHADLVRNGDKPRYAALLFMAPAPRNADIAAVWVELAQFMVSYAGERGAVHLIAEAPDTGREADALYSAGFSPLVHQDVLKLPRIPDDADTIHIERVAGETVELRPQKESDEPLIRLLAMRTVPKLVQRAEITSDLARLTHRIDCGFNLFNKGELTGHVSVRRGRRGYSLQLLFHPSAETQVEAALRYALGQIGGRTHHRPIYCTVPSYQSWLLPTLGRLGFAHVTSNILMIRHTIATVKQPVWSLDARGATGGVVHSKPNAHQAVRQA
ncbi:MAG: hypothetical protein RMN25_12010 [Anaerolineae bacterium]|nr:hypothetical protein [Thermoflexales bacterium]MDW8408495.1 hypothetical protein [Anaerolineae bacterium]